MGWFYIFLELFSLKRWINLLHNKQIMNVKLKPVNVEKKKHIYKQRHPVLKELQEKITKKCHYCMLEFR